ncbi:CLUMA_CG002264, isoform A [Clunio marinus]|uniref:CLUMA_CG002264, isoform A n=1 Tax=Clunio marinus TaxID=568069 RepID=A0A1J1HKB6_9DIPT|nr:CLUMA_CG002264, isoform A [Clunio marinus]
MVGMRNEAIISMRFVRSKLRKREESSHVVNSNEATQPTHVVSTTVEPVGFRQSPSSVWHFPPLPPQPNLYTYNANSQDALVRSDKLGLRGFRKQLSGRFKRLVSKKAPEPAPTIPPELKPQLKTIYVY